MYRNLHQMSQSKTQKPFNMLLRFEAQKTTIDKVYDFVIFQGRIIVIFVMLLIIVAFAIRFPLDYQLNDEKNKGLQNVRSAQSLLEGNEKKAREEILRVEVAKKYQAIYDKELNIASAKPGQIRIEQLISIINKYVSVESNGVTITGYSYQGDPLGGSMLNIEGGVIDVSKTEILRTVILSEKELVTDVGLPALNRTQGNNPKFSMEVKIREKIGK